MAVKRSIFLAGAAAAPITLLPVATLADGAGAKLVVYYNTPKDASAFDTYYANKHAPLAKTLPGLKDYTISTGAVVTPGAASPPYHMVAILSWDSLDALNAALASPQGAATVKDLGNFAQAGAVITIFSARQA